LILDGLPPARVLLVEGVHDNEADGALNILILTAFVFEFLPAQGAENGLKFTIVRPFNWIGPRMDFIPGVDGPSEGVPRVLACFSNVCALNSFCRYEYLGFALFSVFFRRFIINAFAESATPRALEAC
jgi:hypothetical protein